MDHQRVEGIVVMEGVQLIFRNFSGQKKKYNDEGQRNFAVKLDDDTAAAMMEDGWPIRMLKAREEDEGDEEGDQPILPVTVRYDKGRPPRVVVITESGRTQYDEDSVEMLDWMDFVNVDVIVRPWNWEMNGKHGVKAYLHSIYVTIEEDPLEKKYADLPIQRI